MHTTPATGIFALLVAALANGQDPAIDALVERGRSHSLAHEWPKALEVLNAVVAKAPDHLDARRWRGHAFTGAGQYGPALQDLDRALELGADDAWTHYARAMAMHHLGRLEDAVRGYTQALAIDPNFYKAYEWRAFSLSRLGRHAAALGDLDLALRQDPGNAWLMFIRGKARAALGDLAGAEEDFWRAIDADDQNADAAAQMGYLKAVLGEPRAAIGWFEKALKLAPIAQCEARPWLFHLYSEAGDAAAAKAQLDALQGLGAEPLAQWPQTIARFLLGSLPKADLLLAARDPMTAEPERLARRCGALLHIAMQQMPRPQSKSAPADSTLAALARCVATDARDQWEWALALHTLRRVLGER